MTLSRPDVGFGLRMGALRHQNLVPGNGKDLITAGWRGPTLGIRLDRELGDESWRLEFRKA